MSVGGQESSWRVCRTITSFDGAHLESEKLKTSKYGSPDSIDHITKRFDETTKRLFRDKNDIQWVPFGSPLDKDMAVGIRGGSLKLSGYVIPSHCTFLNSQQLSAEVAELFEPSIQAAVTSIKAQVVASQGMIKVGPSTC